MTPLPRAPSPDAPPPRSSMKRAGIATAIGMLAAFTAYAPAAAPALSAPVPGAKCSSETSAAQARVRAGSHATERHQPGAAKVAAMEKDFHDRLGQLATSGRLKAAASITVRVHFQVITSGSTGSLSDATLNKQLSVLNAAYAPSGVSFTLASI